MNACNKHTIGFTYSFQADWTVVYLSTVLGSWPFWCLSLFPIMQNDCRPNPVHDLALTLNDFAGLDWMFLAARRTQLVSPPGLRVSSLRPHFTSPPFASDFLPVTPRPVHICDCFEGDIVGFLGTDARWFWPMITAI